MGYFVANRSLKVNNKGHTMNRETLENKKTIGSIIAKNAELVILLFSFLTLDIVDSLSIFSIVDYSRLFPITTVIRYFVIFLLLVVHRDEIQNFNLDGFSILLLVMFNSATLVNSLPRYIAIVTISLSIFFLWIRKIDKEVGKVRVKQVFQFLAGLVLGFLLISIKYSLINHDIILTAIAEPTKLVICAKIALSKALVMEEFIYRGFLYGLLEKSGIRYSKIFIISSILWSFSHIGISTNFLFFVDVFISGLFFGFLVYKTKSISIAIGTHVGYNSLILFGELFT